MNTRGRRTLIFALFLLFTLATYAQPVGGGWSKNVSLQVKGIPGRSGASS